MSRQVFMSPAEWQTCVRVLRENLAEADLRYARATAPTVGASVAHRAECDAIVEWRKSIAGMLRDLGWKP